MLLASEMLFTFKKLDKYSLRYVFRIGRSRRIMYRNTVDRIRKLRKCVGKASFPDIKIS